MPRALWVPATFWLDHADRCGVDPISERQCGQQFEVILTDEQLENLRSDAQHYAQDMGGEEWGREPYGLSIINSAKRTVAALDKQGA
jgi:hypothetical protein